MLVFIYFFNCFDNCVMSSFSLMSSFFCALLCFQIILPMTRSLSAMVSMVFSCHYVDVSNLTRYFTSLFFSLSLSLFPMIISSNFSFLCFPEFCAQGIAFVYTRAFLPLISPCAPSLPPHSFCSHHWSLCPFSSLLFWGCFMRRTANISPQKRYKH